MATKSTTQVFFSRLLSTFFLWLAVSAVFLSQNAWAFVSLIFVLGAAATNEYFKMAAKAHYPAQRGLGTLTSLGYIGLGCCILALHGNAGLDMVSQMDGAFIAGVTLCSFIYQLLFKVESSEPLTKVASTTLGFLYIAFLFSFMARIIFLTPEHVTTHPTVPGAWLLLWLCVVTKFTDMGAYLTGTFCGKVLKLKTHKMIPHISPGKTWEGFFGAIIIALASAALLYALMPVKLAILSSWTHVIILGMLLPLFAVVGDLAESVIKRSLSIKDSGNFLPGIGGTLDLIDSLCFTAPVLYFYLIWIH